MKNRRSVLHRFSLVTIFALFPFIIFAQVLLGPKKRIGSIIDFQNNSSVDIGTRICIDDIDGDGSVDIVLSANNSIIRYEKLVNSTDFILLDTIAISAAPLKQLLLADMDNDGDLDLFYHEVESLNSINNQIIWQENLDGQANFGPPITIATVEPRDIKIGDLDGDGDGDLILAPESDNLQVRWYENVDNQNLFVEKGDFSSSLNRERIHVVDLDLDGDLDIITNSSSARLYLNDGTGFFSGENGSVGYSGTTIYSSNGATSFDIGDNSVFDYDLDGDLDIIVGISGIWDDGTYWIENDEGTYLDHKPILDSAIWPHTPIEFLDIDSDGDMDIISTNKYLNSNGNPEEMRCISIVWNENKLNDLDSFAIEQILYEECAGSYPDIEDFFPVDADHDGDVDLFYIDRLVTGKIYWLENLKNNPRISGHCFFDENQNKIKDPQEINLSNHAVIIDPDEILSISSGIDSFSFVLNPGSYTIASEMNEDWVLTTDSLSYSIILTDSLIDNLNFGFFPAEIYDNIESQIISNPTRCGFEVPFWINVLNNGTKYSSGRFELIIDPLTSVVNIEPSPSSIIGNTLVWEFDNLPPTYSQQIKLDLEMPGVDKLGDTLNFQAETYYEDDQGILQNSNTTFYNPIVNCAFDPNDKQVNPEGIGFENYTLFGSTLEYMVRFQNTGTDTAFVVKIEDALDENLNWTSFEVLSSSHNYQALLNQENGLVEFIFNNILLPDSTTNEAASHGYIRYAIDPNSSLNENTVISNLANIFFDFNPPITTNTTINTFVSEIVSSIEISSEIDIEIAPNPFYDYFSVRVGDLPTKHMVNFNLFDLRGRKIGTYELLGNSEILVYTDNILAGLYLFEIKDIHGNALGNGKIVKH